MNSDSYSRNMRLTRFFYAGVYLFFFIPWAIFLLGWVKEFYSIPIVLVSAYSLWRLFQKQFFSEIPFIENRKTILRVFFIIFVWTWLSGVGGYAHQTYDHNNRNAVIKDLIQYNWPVINTEQENARTLSYYVGYYMIPCLAGKLLGLEGAYFFCFVYAFAGLAGTYILISQWLKRYTIWTILIFIIFSGLDIFPYLFIYRPEVDGNSITWFQKAVDIIGLRHAPHLEWYTHPWINCSMTSLLFWAYNYVVPFSLGMMLLLQTKINQGLFFLYSLLFISAPFPAFGLFPAVLYIAYRNANFRLYEMFQKSISLLNVLSIINILIIGLYYQSNNAVGIVALRPFTSTVFWLFIFYFVTEYLVYMIFLSNLKDPLFWLLFGVVCVTSLFQVGEGSDFSMRTCMAFFFYLMLLVMRQLASGDTSKFQRYALITVLCIGAITPLMEFKRSLGNTAITLLDKDARISKTYYIRLEETNSVFTMEADNNPFWKNFTGTTDCLFFKYLAR